MLQKLHRRRGDLTACLIVLLVTVGSAGVGMLLKWPAAAIVVSSLVWGLAFGFLVLTIRQATTRIVVFVREHGNMLLRQAEFTMELRRMLEPRAFLPCSRDWAAGPDLLAAIAEVIMDTRPTTVVECGAGISTITSSLAIQKFCPPGATMLTLEHDEAWAEESRRRIRRHGLESVSRIAHVPLVDRGTTSRGWTCPSESIFWWWTALRASPRRWHAIPRDRSSTTDFPPARSSSSTMRTAATSGPSSIDGSVSWAGSGCRW